MAAVPAVIAPPKDQAGPPPRRPGPVCGSRARRHRGAPISRDQPCRTTARWTAHCYALPLRHRTRVPPGRRAHGPQRSRPRNGLAPTRTSPRADRSRHCRAARLAGRTPPRNALTIRPGIHGNRDATTLSSCHHRSCDLDGRARRLQPQATPERSPLTWSSRLQSGPGCLSEVEIASAG